MPLSIRNCPARPRWTANRRRECHAGGRVRPPASRGDGDSRACLRPDSGSASRTTRPHLVAVARGAPRRTYVGRPSVDAPLEALFARGIDPHESSDPRKRDTSLTGVQTGYMNAASWRKSSNFLTQPFFLRVSTIRSEGVRWMVAGDSQSGASAATVVAYGTVPTIVPETRQNSVSRANASQLARSGK